MELLHYLDSNGDTIGRIRITATGEYALVTR